MLPIVQPILVTRVSPQFSVGSFPDSAGVFRVEVAVLSFRGSDWKDFTKTAKFHVTADIAVETTDSLRDNKSVRNSLS